LVFKRAKVIVTKILFDSNYLPYTKVTGSKKRKKFFLCRRRNLEETMGILPREAMLVLSALGQDLLPVAAESRAPKTTQPFANGHGVLGHSSSATLTEQASRLNGSLVQLTPWERLARFRKEISGRIVLTTSFGMEGQVILHLIAEHDIDVEIATLDTGRLFPETYALWAETERRYGRRIEAIYPQHANLEALVKKDGVNGFYNSRDARLACCHARKVEPLNRALAGAAGWITGLRADQSNHRESTRLVGVDERKLLKLSPLFDWTREQVHAFAVANKVPINPLHAKGFVSIGCAPCTRAVTNGEPERAGRWWWERSDKKECGLHTAIV
jgi:phosphoadenosine phosphosulfate reductase